MATTQTGRILTDQHRRQQVALAANIDSRVRAAWGRIDLSNIDGSRARFEREMTTILATYHRVSQVQASRYLAAFRVAETGSTSGPIVTPRLDLATDLAVLDAVGPQGLKNRIGQGTLAVSAHQATGVAVIAEARKMVLAGGRGVVRESGRRDSRANGWRRVSDGDPCTFCAMLVSRGPAYTSEAAALAKGNGDPYHANCGCTVEVLYGEWEPTALEQQFVDSYEAAAQKADDAGESRTAKTVLYRMREDGLFRDSPLRRQLPF